MPRALNVVGARFDKNRTISGMVYVANDQLSKLVRSQFDAQQLVHFQLGIIRCKEKRGLDWFAASFEIVRDECFEFTVPELSSFYPSFLPFSFPSFSWKFVPNLDEWCTHSSESSVVGIRKLLYLVFLGCRVYLFPVSFFRRKFCLEILVDNCTRI